METYKKPIIASNSSSESTVLSHAYGAPALLRKLFGGDDFHVEKALTTRKDLSK